MNVGQLNPGKGERGGKGKIKGAPLLRGGGEEAPTTIPLLQWKYRKLKEGHREISTRGGQGGGGVLGWEKK